MPIMSTNRVFIKCRTGLERIGTGLCGTEYRSNSEVTVMSEKKAKPAAKKVVTAKAGSAAAGQAKTKSQIKSKSQTKTKIKAGKTAPAPAAGKPVAKKQTAKKPVAGKTGVATAEAEKAKAPVEKKTAAPVAKKKSAMTKAANSKAVPAKANRPADKPTPEERYRMVETAAYFIAERHGFQGRSDEHWAAAEREIAAKLDK
jgi:hypothetical protein